MTRLEDRQNLVRTIEQARLSGARVASACDLAGINRRTPGVGAPVMASTQGDRRPDAVRPTPSHALSEAERARIIAVVNESRFAETRLRLDSSYHSPMKASTLPARPVSIGCCARLWSDASARRHRPPRPSRPPATHIAARPGQVWRRDVTFLPTQVEGHWFYLYPILDLYSRKVVGFEVHANDSADHAAHLAKRTALVEGVHSMAIKPVLHGDNGASLKATTVLAMLYWLGIKPSYFAPGRQQRQRLLRSAVPHRKVLPAVPRQRVCRSRCCPPMGRVLRPLVQRRAPP